MNRIITFTLFILTMNSCVSTRIFNDLESRYALLKNNYTQQTKTIEKIKNDLDELNKKYKAQEKSLSLTYDSLRAKKQSLEKLKTSLELLKENSESALRVRILENEKLMERISERENELDDKITRVNDLERLINQQKELMQGLKEKLSNALLNYEGKGLSVEAREGKVYVSMENKLLFQSGSWDVETEGKSALTSLGEVLSDNPDISILIEGHTDNVPFTGSGSIKGNWDLSTKRATSIVNILLENPEILPQNLTAAGRGEYLPIAPNSTREGRSANRRIEVILSPQLDKITQIINTLD
tara:strand:+ start:8409 stop:9305 length:897 start_codon:yes stop_codon:yes gene_type:complete